jgi:hypothetical protein
LSRDYEATLAAAVKNGFTDLLAREKSSKVFVIEADSFQPWHVSTIFHEFVIPPARKGIFSITLQHLPLRTQIPQCEGAYEPQASTAR